MIRNEIIETIIYGHLTSEAIDLFTLAGESTSIRDKISSFTIMFQFIQQGNTSTKACDAKKIEDVRKMYFREHVCVLHVEHTQILLKYVLMLGTFLYLF